MKPILTLGLAIFLLATAGAVAQEEPPPQLPEDLPPLSAPYPSKPPLKSRFYFGGWLGASAGSNVERLDVAPEVGFEVSPRVHLGASLVYRYRKDKRFDPDLSTNDIGGSLYGRYFVYEPFYLQAGLEQLSWEFIGQGLDGPTTLSSDHTAVLIGPGFALPMGPRAASYMTILYDVNYNRDGPNPYDSPWVFRIGIGIGL